MGSYFTIAKVDLLGMLQFVTPTMSTGQDRWSNRYYIYLNAEKLHIRTTDTFCYAEANIALLEHEGTASFSVDQIFVKQIDAMPNDTIHITVDQNTHHIICTVPGKDIAINIAILDDLEGERIAQRLILSNNEYQIAQNLMVQSLEKLSPFVFKDDAAFRKPLSQLALRDKACLTASENVLARIVSSRFCGSFNLGRLYLRTLYKCLKTVSYSEHIYYGESDGFYIFRDEAAQRIVSVPKYQSEFPPIEEPLLHESRLFTCSIDREELCHALATVGLSLERGFYRVEFLANSFTKKLTLISKKYQLNASHYTLDITASFSKKEEVEFAANYLYLLQCIKACSAATIELSLSDTETNLYIKDQFDNFSYYQVWHSLLQNNEQGSIIDEDLLKEADANLLEKDTPVNA